MLAHIERLRLYGGMYMFGEAMVSKLISKGRFPGKPPPGGVVKCMEALFMPMMSFQVVPGSKEFGETYGGTMKPTVTPEEFEFARLGLDWSSSRVHACARLKKLSATDVSWLGMLRLTALPVP